MSKKLEGNGMWQTKFILPEHGEQTRQQQINSRRKQRPRVDEQAFEEYGRLIQESLKAGKLLTVSVYDEFEDVRVSGYVQQIDPHLHRVLFVHDHKRTWIPYQDIMHVEPY